MLTGQCLCGAISYQLNAPIHTIECCHCLTCRKAHSSAFAMGVTICRNSFELLSGESQLAEFESSAGKFRVFCRGCGAHVYAYKPSQSDTLRLRPALLETDLAKFEIQHIHTEHQLSL